MYTWSFHHKLSSIKGSPHDSGNLRILSLDWRCKGTLRDRVNKQFAMTIAWFMCYAAQLPPQPDKNSAKSIFGPVHRITCFGVCHKFRCFTLSHNLLTQVWENYAGKVLGHYQKDQMLGWSRLEIIYPTYYTLWLYTGWLIIPTDFHTLSEGTWPPKSYPKYV